MAAAARAMASSRDFSMLNYTLHFIPCDGIYSFLPPCGVTVAASLLPVLVNTKATHSYYFLRQQSDLNVFPEAPWFSFNDPFFSIPHLERQNKQTFVFVLTPNVISAFPPHAQPQFTLCALCFCLQWLLPSPDDFCMYPAPLYTYLLLDNSRACDYFPCRVFYPSVVSIVFPQ